MALLKWVAVRHRRPPGRPPPPPLVRPQLHSNLTFQSPKYSTSQHSRGYGPTYHFWGPANRMNLNSNWKVIQSINNFVLYINNDVVQKCLVVPTTWLKVFQSVSDVVQHRPKRVSDLAKICPKFVNDLANKCSKSKTI